MSRHIPFRLITTFILIVCMCAACFAGCGKGSETEDRTFIPGSFKWSGGSGRIEMTCPQVRMENGQAYATIVVDSEHYTWFKVDGKEYPTTHDGDTSSAEIPVVLDKEMEISGQTTAMSEPHEITYTIFVGSGQEEAGAEAAEDRSAGDGENAAAAADAGENDAELSSDEMKTETGPAEIEGLTFDRAMELEYAECFDVYYYQDGYKLIDIHGDTRFLVIPEGRNLPESVTPADASGKAGGSAGEAVFGLLKTGEPVKILRCPVQNVYMAATAVMAQVNAIGAIEMVRLSGTDADGWYLDAPKEALASGKMIYAGKYSEPDYELLVQEGCTLAVESTMIGHSPDVKEKLEELDIPVLTDHSSYEEHPLGRAEWVKLYGAVFDKEEEAAEQFSEQTQVIEELEGFENTGKTVAFFYISQDGTAVVRSAEDYIPRMIEIAGGKYMFEDLTPAAGSSAAVNLAMEEFYAAASDADYLIYNATIDAPLNSLQDLTAKSDLFSEFKAVQEGQVWTTDKNLYQASDSIGRFIRDLHTMLTDGDEKDMEFLRRVS